MSFFTPLNNRILFLLSTTLFTAVSLGALNYTVAESDTLYGISRRFNLPIDWIIRVNSLKNETIHPGQNLQIPVDGINTLEIRPGDTLSDLALEFGISEDYLRRYNGLENDILRIGEKLKIPPPEKSGTYRVLSGDTLLGIALTHGIDVNKLRLYNNLENDNIYPGEELIVESPRPEGHKVKEGESLWTISRDYGIKMEELKSWNNISGDVIHPGDLLALYPGINTSDIKVEPRVNLASLPGRRIEIESEKEVPDIPGKGEYFFSFPKSGNQPSVSYWESPDASITTDYQRALKVLDIFKSEIAALPVIDNALKGWKIVIDPGHGGLDPGAIVSVSDGNGNPVVITEDEYAYDISLRLYRSLYRHGASVSLTILAPDHHIRDGIDARQTFVHRKNEVYNSASQNGVNGWRPVGTTDGLDMRKSIAAEQIQDAHPAEKRKGTIYISIHADNTPDLPEGTAVLFDGADEDEKERSKALASALTPFLGQGSFIHNQPLRVLENNPADAAVLVEVRNIHYTRNAWALRSAVLREQDAAGISSGILAWAAE